MLCDSHVHVTAPLTQAPQIAGRTFTAEEAPLAVLLANGRPLGLQRFVIVQASFYGTDNSVLLGALDALGEDGRGVAVVDPASVGDGIHDLKARGVEGLRVNLYSPAAEAVGGSSNDLSAVCDMAEAASMHVEIIAPLRIIVDRAGSIERMRVPVVLDHYGLPGETRPEDPAGRELLRLMACPHVWMKLSSPYRRRGASLEVEPDREWLRALVDAAPDRCVWGSDWPHPPAHEDHRGPDTVTPFRQIPYGQLFERFRANLGSGDEFETIFVRNPANLYGFRADGQRRQASKNQGEER